MIRMISSNVMPLRLYIKGSRTSCPVACDCTNNADCNHGSHPGDDLSREKDKYTVIARSM